MTELHDARFGARWTFRQRLKNDATYLALRAVDAGCRALPHAFAERLVLRLARAVVLRSPVARRNVESVFPQWSSSAHTALLERHAERLAHHAQDLLAAVWGRRPHELLGLRADSLEALQAARAAGRGVVLASAHLGAWERVAHTLAGLGPFAAVVREPYDARLSRWLDPLRAPVRTIARGAPGAARAMLRVLRAGGVLGVPMDLATRGVHTTPVAFLGQRTDVVTGPARLALRTGAALVVATYTHQAGREWLRVRPVPTDRADAENDADVARRVETDVTAALARELTDAILQCPEEWLWLHPRWTNSVSAPLYSEHGGRRQART